MTIVRRYLLVLVVCTALGGGGALALSLLATPAYTSQASLFVSLEAAGSANDLAQGSTFTRDQMASYSTLATTPAVLEPVIAELGLDTDARALARQVSASPANDTVILQVEATSGSATEAAGIANAVAGQLSRVIEEVAPAGTEGRATVRVTTVAPAAVPEFASSPNTRVNVAAGLVLGLALGLLCAWLRETLDTRVRDQAGLAKVTQLPLIGSIGDLAGHGTRPVVVQVDPHSPQAESFRQLRTNLQFLGLSPDPVSGADGGPRTLVVTSARAGEGKSTVAANLAVAMAETGARVLLVDADLRRPTVAGLLGLEGAAGLTTVLSGRAALADVVQPWGPMRLDVLTSGTTPPNPTELLGSPAMIRLLDEMAGAYEFVVLDAAPLLAVADAAVLAHRTDGTVLVANVRQARRPQLAEALENLEKVGARVLGVVLNGVRRDEQVYAYQRRQDDGVVDVIPDAPPSSPRPEEPAGPGQRVAGAGPARPGAALPDARVGAGSRGRSSGR
ncbi:polysaccharide biosynthesis tyrosine autokinase [Modestobacter sp. SYSU DS0290]